MIQIESQAKGQMLRLPVKRKENNTQLHSLFLALATQSGDPLRHLRSGQNCRSSGHTTDFQHQNQHLHEIPDGFPCNLTALDPSRIPKVFFFFKSHPDVLGASLRDFSFNLGRAQQRSQATLICRQGCDPLFQQGRCFSAFLLPPSHLRVTNPPNNMLCHRSTTYTPGFEQCSPLGFQLSFEINAPHPH